jgi:hypothetical protein
MTRNEELVREAFEAANRGDLEWLIEHATGDALADAELDG